MHQLEREFLFAVGAPDGPRSIPWRVRTTPATRPNTRFPVEVYIDALRPGRVFHASLHSSGDWHIAFDRPYTKRPDAVLPPGRDRIEDSWEPDVLYPGMIRAFAIIVPATEVQVPAHGRVEEREDIYWAPKPAFGLVTHFNVFLTRLPVRESGWPGMRAMGTRFVGRLTMPGWGRLWIVVHDEPEIPEQRQKWNDYRRRAQIAPKGFEAAEPRAILVGDLADGTRCFTDLLL